MALQHRQDRTADDGAAGQGQPHSAARRRGDLMSEDPLLTVEQVASRLQMSPLTVMHWLRTGQLPGVKLAKFWRVRASALEALLHGPEPQGTTPAGAGEAGRRRGLGTGGATPPEGDGAQVGAVLLALIHTLFPEGQPVPPRLL
jgi:excisionase family DNA binding protein